MTLTEEVVTTWTGFHSDIVDGAGFEFTEVTGEFFFDTHETVRFQSEEGWFGAVIDFPSVDAEAGGFHLIADVVDCVGLQSDVEEDTIGFPSVEEGENCRELECVEELSFLEELPSASAPAVGASGTIPFIMDANNNGKKVIHTKI